MLGEKGQVYHITPEDGLGPDINVHWSELKVILGQEQALIDAPVDIPWPKTAEERRRPE